MKKYIAIDIGGTRIKHGLIDENGQILQNRIVVGLDLFKAELIIKRRNS